MFTVSVGMMWSLVSGGAPRGLASQFGWAGCRAPSVHGPQQPPGASPSARHDLVAETWWVFCTKSGLPVMRHFLENNFPQCPGGQSSDESRQ